MKKTIIAILLMAISISSFAQYEWDKVVSKKVLQINGNVQIPALKKNSTKTTEFTVLPNGDRIGFVREDTTYQALNINGPKSGGNYYWGRFAGNPNSISGGNNVGIGDSAVFATTTGYGVIGIGLKALKSNTTGYINTAVGNRALMTNTIGFNNTALGGDALRFNISGSYNTGGGAFALYRNTTGLQNTAFGSNAMTSDTSGSYNTAIGVSALSDNTSGSYNVVVGGGIAAHLTGSNNTAIGYHPLHYGGAATGNVCIGYLAGENHTGNNKLIINNTNTGGLIYGDFATSQVQINAASTPSLTTCAALDIKSNTMGLLLPRMTKTERNAIVTPVAGLCIYQTDNTPGLRMYNGTNWMKFTEATD